MLRWRDNEILWTLILACVVYVGIWNHDALSAWVHKVVMAIQRG